MNQTALRDRRQRVLEKIERERLELVEHAWALNAAVAPLDRVRQGFSHFTGHPLLWLVSAGFTIFSVGPSRMFKTFLSAWNMWQIFRFLKNRGLGRR